MHKNKNNLNNILNWKDLSFCIEDVLFKDDIDKIFNCFTNVLLTAKKLDNAGYPIIISALTRRCNNLFFIYYNIIKKYSNTISFNKRPNYLKNYKYNDLIDIKETYEKFVIDKNFSILMIPDIILNYKNTGIFPHIFVIDDILIHGSEINNFIYNFEYYLNIFYSLLINNKDNKKFITDIFLKKLHISIIRKCNEKNNIIQKYIKLIENNNSICSLSECISHAVDYNRFISIYSYNNISSSISFSFNEENDIILNNKTTFTKVSTLIHKIKQDHWIKFFPNPKNPIIICSISKKKIFVNNKILYIPNIILDHISINSFKNLFKKILIDIKDNNKQIKCNKFFQKLNSYISYDDITQNNFYLTPIFSIIKVILTFLLMKQFLTECNISKDKIINLLFNNIDWDYIISNFKFNCKIDKENIYNINDIFIELFEIMINKSLNEYLSILTTNANSIAIEWMDFTQPSDNNLIDNNSIIYKYIERILSRNVYNYEKFILQQIDIKSSMPITVTESDINNNPEINSIDTLLNIFNNYDIQYNISCDNLNIYYVIAVILCEIDYGNIKLEFSYMKHPNKNLEIYYSNKYEIYSGLISDINGISLLINRYKNLLNIFNNIYERNITNNKLDFDRCIFELKRLSKQLIKKFENNKIIEYSDCSYSLIDEFENDLIFTFKTLIGLCYNYKNLRVFKFNNIDKRISKDCQLLEIETNYEFSNKFLHCYNMNN